MQKKYCLLMSWSVLLLLTIGCKKDVKPFLPAGTQDAALNFYNASEVLSSLPFYGYGNNNPKYILIDTLADSVGVQAPFPTLAGQAYPDDIGGADVYNAMQYIRLKAGSHRIRFSDTARAIHIIADTTVNLSPLSHTALYLTDVNSSSNDIAAYHIIAVPEERSCAVDRIRMRMVNLSPDVGTISCYLQKADGSTLFSPLPRQLSFGAASSYVELDTAGAKLGSMTLQIIADRNPGNNLLTTRLSASPGHSYVVVVQGFSQTVTRQVPVGKNPNGSLRYSPVTIPANVRAIIRESY